METNISETLEDVLLESELERADRERVQQAWDEQVARAESKQLSRISRVLVSIWEITSLILKLEPGQSISIDRNGNIWKGRVKTEKMTLLPQKLGIGKRIGHFDTGAFQSMKTGWSVSGGGGKPFKNSWNNSRTRKAREDKNYFPLDMRVEMFLLFRDEIPVTDLLEETADFMGYNVIEYTWTEFPNITTGLLSGTSTVLYYKIDGKMTVVK